MKDVLSDLFCFVAKIINNTDTDRQTHTHLYAQSLPLLTFFFLTVVSCAGSKHVDLHQSLLAMSN